MRMVIFAIFHTSITCAADVDTTQATLSCEHCVRLCCASENECDKIYGNFDNFRRDLSEFVGNYEIAYGRPCGEMQQYASRWSLEVSRKKFFVV